MHGFFEMCYITCSGYGEWLLVVKYSSLAYVFVISALIFYA